MPRFRFLLVSLVFLPGITACLDAAPRAVIVVGLAAGETQADRLNTTATTIRDGFITRGFPPASVTILGAATERIRRDTVLNALKPAVAASADDETWIVLLGSATTRNGEPSFQITGPRLTATDLATAVKALPGRKFVVVGTTASGGFLPPLLALPEVEAVAATADTGEINEPRFTAAWAESLADAPQATFAALADAAATRVASFYQTASLAQGEHARLIDRAAGRIIEAPFSKAIAPTATPSAAPSSPKPVSVADIEIPKPAGTTDIERRPATDETRALIAEARDAAKEVAHAALFLRVDATFVIGRDFSVIERHRTRAFLRTGESLDDLGTLMLPSNPPAYTTRLEGVRVITPDGAQILVNPRAYDERRAADTREADEARAKGQPTGPLAPPFLPLPEVTAGCLVEAAWTIERQSAGTLPEFSQEWSLAERYPMRALHLSVTTPSDTRWRTFAPNLPAPEPAGRTALSGPTQAKPDKALNTQPDAALPEASPTRTTTWLLTDVAAFETRAGDPPARRFAPWVGVSSLASWDAFAGWYQRIATGSAESGPAVALLADDIARAHPDRAGRLRAAYERVSSIRYVAIELGVGAFRPRTPEQVWTQRYGDCKDKANLLVAVLGKLGIAAEFALVNRYDHTFTVWPAWQFNHALARVPADPANGQPHDLWLDTTDRLVPFGIVAPGDLGRHAFAFNAQGVGAFQEITASQEPASIWKELWTRHDNGKATLLLGADGAAGVSLRHLFLNLSPAQRARRLQSLYSTNEFTVTALSVGDPYDLAAPFLIEAKVNLLRADLPPPFSAPGLASLFATETISRPLWWDEGRATKFVHARGQLEIPAGPITPDAYAALRARWLDFSR